MSILTVYSDSNAAELQTITNPEAIANKLSNVDVRFERWVAERKLDDSLTQQEIIDAYRSSVDSAWRCTA